MKSLLFFTLFFVGVATSYAQHALTKIWSTDTILATPESVLFDAQNKILYVSLIDGDPSAKDGKGGIAKVDLDGKIQNAAWVTGLNAPKGMAMYGNNLYVADITDVVVIDIAKGIITATIPVAGAVFLNDVTTDNRGAVFVSDSDKGTVHKIVRGKAVLYLDNLKGPNGVLAIANDLYILASGSLMKADAGRKLQTIASDMDASTDGIEEVKAGEFIVSCWNGIVYYVKTDGSKQVLADTRASKINSADIGYDRNTKIVYVPTFFKNSVVAYRL